MLVWVVFQVGIIWVDHSPPLAQEMSQKLEVVGVSLDVMMICDLL